MNKGVPYFLGLCCVWPLVVYAGIEWIRRVVMKRDWTNIRWNEIQWPWSKHD
jgi:hypothetical protein